MIEMKNPAMVGNVALQDFGAGLFDTARFLTDTR
jgi:hypothetical protein